MNEDHHHKVFSIHLPSPQNQFYLTHTNDVMASQTTPVTGEFASCVVKQGASRVQLLAAASDSVDMQVWSLLACKCKRHCDVVAFRQVVGAGRVLSLDSVVHIPR